MEEALKSFQQMCCEVMPNEDPSKDIVRLSTIHTAIKMENYKVALHCVLQTIEDRFASLIGLNVNLNKEITALRMMMRGFENEDIMSLRYKLRRAFEDIRPYLWLVEKGKYVNPILQGEVLRLQRENERLRRKLKKL